MQLIKEFSILFARIITIFPLMILVTLYMGKRSVAELPVFDFLVVLTLGAVVGADIADPEIMHIHTAVAIILIGLFQRVVSTLKIKHAKFRGLITFEPTIVVQDGKFIVANLRSIKYSIDNILQMLREKEIFDIADVYLGIVESNGNMSALKKANKTEVTIEDMNLTKSEPSLSYPVVLDGKVYSDTLSKLNLSEVWLKQQLSSLGINRVEEVFFASVNMRCELHVSPKNFAENKNNVMPIYN